MNVKAKLISGLAGGAYALLATGLFSCGLINEDLEECPNPRQELRFVYEYNMEYANAFHKQVDCLTVYFYNSEGRLVKTEKVTDRTALESESYRMYPELPAGSYHVVAYGGMGCDQASFKHVNSPTEGDHYTNLHVKLDEKALTDKAHSRLHNHYYGKADFTVDPTEDSYATVEMMRNTNSIQVALQHLNGSAIDSNDFIYEITDDNDDFDYDNNLLATGEIKYNPWNTENRTTGTVGRGETEDEEDARDWHAALAQFTTSRLVAAKQTPATLHVKRSADSTTVFRVPLVNYMLLFKHDNSGAGMDNMGDQEYLDRENTWNFVFFLDENKDNMWVNTHIIINDWEVRLNSADF